MWTAMPVLVAFATPSFACDSPDECVFEAMGEEAVQVGVEGRCRGGDGAACRLVERYVDGLAIGNPKVEYYLGPSCKAGDHRSCHVWARLVSKARGENRAVKTWHDGVRSACAEGRDCLVARFADLAVDQGQLPYTSFTTAVLFQDFLRHCRAGVFEACLVVGDVSNYVESLCPGDKTACRQLDADWKREVCALEGNFLCGENAVMARVAGPDDVVARCDGGDAEVCALMAIPSLGRDDAPQRRKQACDLGLKAACAPHDPAFDLPRYRLTDPPSEPCEGRACVDACVAGSTGACVSAHQALDRVMRPR